MRKLIPTDGVFFVGNGRVAMGGEGADILQLFAPCYSIPGVVTLKMTDDTVIAQNYRVGGSAGYITQLTDKRTQTPLGEITDYTHPTLPVFIRKFHLARPVTFVVESSFSMADTSSVYGDGAIARLFEIPDGTVVFSKSKTDKETFCQLLISPHCIWEEGKITFPEGESRLFFVGGDYGAQGRESFSNCMKLSLAALSFDLEAVFEDFNAHWSEIFGKIRVDREELTPVPHPDELIEAVAIALITQTSAEGGTIAGAFYHLAYGRDMYGVFRGFMALGLYDYARRMVDYLVGIYRDKGYMPNASGMGMPCSHRHENDDVEQTGYYLLELLEYTEATGDVDFLRDKMSYARFLLEAQEAQLAGGMIPFNGDETYIAGGIFPRGGIDHGSMEATALYIGSSLKLLDMAEAYELLDESYIKVHRAPAMAAKAAFIENFTDGDRVYINQPARVALAELPAYRHGVCHHCMWMTNLIRTPEGGYLCANCYGKYPASIDHSRYSTDCALWMSVFTGCSLLPEKTIRAALEGTVARLRADSFGETNLHNTVGYELGVVLYALTRYVPSVDLPAYRDILDALLDDRVKGLVWTEYYKNGQPSTASCPYRPWESGINLVCILAYCKALIS
ncbi:MAG: hypothetical protein E7661_02290 [Ruminococcaceae bacterium]|nr:hypothetical protein [Oscillospiraceae bacterium]